MTLPSTAQNSPSESGSGSGSSSSPDPAPVAAPSRISSQDPSGSEASKKHKAHTQSTSATSPPLPSPSPSPSPSPKVSKKQTVDQLRGGLAQLGLDTRGKKETLWRRLANALHRATLRDPPSDDSDTSDTEIEVSLQAGPSSSTVRVLKQPYKSFLCFDVEATCRPGKEFDWPNEIIEFPVVLLRWTDPDTNGKRKLQKIDHFRSYVRPTWKPILSEFCKDLTGITQETVDKSPTFPQMLKKFEKWLDKWDLRNDKGLKDALWVTDGPWDLRDFVPKQLHITPINPQPSYFHGPYLNLKFAVQAVLSETYRRDSYAAERPNIPPNARATSPITTQRVSKSDKPKTGKVRDVGKSFYFNIPGMVEALNLGEFEGRQHSGLDDATNIARILISLSEKDVMIEANGRLQPVGSGKRYPWMGKKGEVIWQDWMSTNKELGPATSGGVVQAKEVLQSMKEGAKGDVASRGQEDAVTVKPDQNVEKGDEADQSEGESIENKDAEMQKETGAAVAEREARVPDEKPSINGDGKAAMGLEEVERGVRGLKLAEKEIKLAPAVAR